MNPIKVIVGIPCLLLGGTEIATLQMIDALRQDSRYQISVLVYYEIDQVMFSRYREHGIEVIALHRNRGKNKKNPSLNT